MPTKGLRDDTTRGWRSGGELTGNGIGACAGFRGWLWQVAVDPDHRRQGVASTMNAHIENGPHGMDARQINLMAHTPNKARGRSATRWAMPIRRQRR